MGRVSDMQIELFDEYYASQQNEPEPVKKKVSHKLNYIGQLQKERDFYKARFEWERARVYKAWRDDPLARKRLAYKRRWKK